MARTLYCPKCLAYGDPQADTCSTCGSKLIPLMRIVIMPFVESGQEPDHLGQYKEVVERDGELLPSLAIGCQLYMASGMERSRLIASQKDTYLDAAERLLPKTVKSFLDPLGFYDIPDPFEVDRIAEQAAHMPTELFVLIQSHYDPEYLFLPEVNYFFFRFPRPHTTGTGMDSGFGFVQVSAFLLDNRDNRIVSRGSGAGLVAYDAGGAVLDENFSVDLDSQLHIMRDASAKAVDTLLKEMKMTR